MSASILETITPSAAHSTARLDTASWFDATFQASEQSPIDEFLENLYGINKLYLQANGRGEYAPMLGSLVYLGMVSAVEGYFRSLLRRLVLIDELCQSRAEQRTVSYGAAVHHTRELLPEALFEGISLASKRGVAIELKTLCGVTQMTKDGDVPHHLDLLFRNFESICQVRHCGIHRFGKLGSQQALRLGIDAHRDVMEKPLKLSVPQLEDIAEALEALVRGVNSYCFLDIIKRTHLDGPAGKPDDPSYSWSWQRDLASDRIVFSRYYDLFASIKKPNQSPSLEDVYAEFLTFIAEQDAKAAAKGRSKSASNSGAQGGAATSRLFHSAPSHVSGVVATSSTSMKVSNPTTTTTTTTTTASPSARQVAAQHASPAPAKAMGSLARIWTSFLAWLKN
ncbi:hypothetical protein [Rhizobacter sp. SG703]|uniref:hypothetical protein n=1 Tax=Rhizobacter sp. SG703 TaxID=2587140 RepID=UPI001445CDE1|nr:hypothetical protein [Rhizobacter sp. SG703]NKI92734.1 hypothetical protein [Rhizobacter sp. SG703]